jgi:predicted nicotinamide N-methyase
LKRYTSKQIQRAIAKFPTKQTEVHVSGDLFLRITEAEDPYELLDHMIEKETRFQRTERFPYWAELWPAAIGLSRWLVRQVRELRATSALELGCGLGLVAVTLSRLGLRIRATDFVEDALIFTSHNGIANGADANLNVAYLDWSSPVGKGTDLLVASDVAYDRKNHPYLNRVLRALLNAGGHLILSDPGRPAARPFFEQLEDVGYTHLQESLAVIWKSTEHKVDIHQFQKPA